MAKDRERERNPREWMHRQAGYETDALQKAIKHHRAEQYPEHRDGYVAGEAWSAVDYDDERGGKNRMKKTDSRERLRNAFEQQRKNRK